MANALNVNPLFFDSTSGASVTGPQRVQAIVWTGTEATNRDIAANEDFAVTDSMGNSIIEKRAIAAGDDLVLYFNPVKEFNGLTVSKLDGGVCYIYLE